ncbi:MAG: cation:proton antiporter [Chitinophagales bacterium]|nr:cation:proton antiporter [Chitinophagales bacterium]MCZ2392659.1 cation:proton antiporter [Chitinophagales bacterium]
MSHLPSIIVDLAIILMTAGVTTIIFKKLKQPVVLGYILAGLLVKPIIFFLPSIKDSSSISIWAEIGIVILLFNLGLEFSVKKMAKIGAVAAPTGVFESMMMLATGYIVGGFLGWSQMDRLFLGGMIAVSSTTIIIRAFEELNLKTQKFTQLVFGVLIVEDIIAVLLLVLLSTISVSQNFEGMDLVFVIIRLGFFLILWFVAGILFIPSLIKYIRPYLDSETILVVALGLCLGMVVMATQVGFSSALGAFLMGSILSETNIVKDIEHQLKSLKNLFGAVFFVSVGMMIDPILLWNNIGIVLILTLTVLAGKSIFVAIGMLMAGQPLKAAVRSGMSMSQIGEFSFIIATLGMSLGVISGFLYPIAVGVSVITTFISPYFIRLSEPTYEFLNKLLPEKWILALENYSNSSQQVSHESDWKRLVKSYFSTVIVNVVIAIGVILLGYHVVYPLETKIMGNGIVNQVLFFVFILLCILPFLWGMLKKRIEKELFHSIWNDRSFNRGPLLALEFARVIAAILVLSFLLSKVISIGVALGIGLIVIMIGLTIFSSRIQSYYNKIENRFYVNFNTKELAIEARAQKMKGLMPWDTHFSDLVVSISSPFVGKSLESIQLREKYGVSIAILDRNYQKIYAPTKDVVILPGDILTLIGDDQQLMEVKELIETPITEKTQSHEKIELGKIVVHQGDSLCGISIRGSQIRELTHGMVIGIERNGERILNPSSDVILLTDDTIWIVGDILLIRELEKKLQEELKSTQ